LKINGYTYNRRDEEQSKARQIGVIAQQLEAVGEIVTNGEHKSVNYLALIPLLIEAVKELANADRNRI